MAIRIPLHLDNLLPLNRRLTQLDFELPLAFSLLVGPHI